MCGFKSFIAMLRISAQKLQRIDMKAVFRVGFALAAILTVLVSGGRLFAAQKAQMVCCEALEKDSPTVRCAESWLHLVDAGDYRQAWIASSELNRHRYHFESWIEKMYSWRKPYGKVNSRELVCSDHLRSLKGYPCGEYYAVQFKTDFQHLCAPACEKVILHCECDCAGCKRWKVVCYSIY